MKSSLLITTYNEETRILELLESILKQTRVPDEVVIVDAASADATCERIEQFLRENKNLRVNLYRESTKVTRSMGRNLAKKYAAHDVLLVTDAGCRLHEHWVEKMMDSFESESVDLVSGIYELPDCLDGFWRAAAELTMHTPRAVDDQDFLPSSRSLGITRHAWEKVGGYPEDLNTAEDLVFAYSLVHMKHVDSGRARMTDSGVKRVCALQARVIWYPPETFTGVITQFYGYAYGDGLAGRASPHRTKYIMKITGFLGLFTLTFFFPLLGALVSTCIIVNWWGWQIGRRWSNKLETESRNYLLGLIVWIPVLFFVTLWGYVRGSTKW